MTNESCGNLLLLQNINEIRKSSRTEIPIFDLETGSRSSSKVLEVSEDCGVVSCNNELVNYVSEISSIKRSK